LLFVKEFIKCVALNDNDPVWLAV